jgi:hypothetical protein
MKTTFPYPREGFTLWGRSQAIVSRLNLIFDQVGKLLELADGFRTFQLHQFTVIAHFGPRNAVIRDQKANQVIIPLGSP